MTIPVEPRTGGPPQYLVAGFPVFSRGAHRPRVVTGNPWDFLRHTLRPLPAPDKERAFAYLEQAYDFFCSAQNPRIASRPLLYYYCFLNLAKVFLLHERKTFPDVLKHGIADPKANVLVAPLVDQEFAVVGVAQDHTELFPELFSALNVDQGLRIAGAYKIEELIRRIPAVHRTYTIVRNANDSFVPIDHVNVLVNGNDVWVSFTLQVTNSRVAAAQQALEARPDFRIFEKLNTSDSNVLKYQSTTMQFRDEPSFYTSLDALAAQLRKLGIWATHTQNGYRYYLFSDTSKMPQLASLYAVIFYLGSITRYRPHDFAKITADYSWLVSEIVDTQPAQWIYVLSSQMARTEVLSAFATSVDRL